MFETITYKGFCALGGLTNPKLSTRNVYVGKHYHHTIYLMQGGNNVIEKGSSNDEDARDGGTQSGSNHLRDSEFLSH